MTSKPLFACPYHNVEEPDDERSLFSTDLVLNALGKAARKALEELMKSGSYEYQSDFARKYFGEGKLEGKLEGKAEGKASGLLAVFEARGIAVSDVFRKTILACRDLDQLDRWIGRAVVIASAQELFE